MKKNYLLLFFILSFYLAQSQTLLDEGFESGVFPSAGWTLINGNAPAGFDWTYNSDPSLTYVSSTHQSYPTYLGTGSMVYEADITNAQAWAITPSLSLSAGVSYTITFYYRSARSDAPEMMKVTVGSDATIGGQSTILWNNNGGTGLANDSAWTQGRIKYVPASSGNFYFGFNCYSDSSKVALIVDDIKVETTPAGVPPCATRLSPVNGATNVSAPEALFTWNLPANAQSASFNFGTTNPPNNTSTIVQGSATYVSALSYNTTYYYSVVPANSLGSASGCPVYSFTTQAAPPIPVNDDPAGAMTITSNGSVSAYTKSATQTRVAESCNGDIGDANDDIWFKFTPLQPGLATITLTPDMIFDGVLNAYSGTPGSFVNIACADQSAEGGQETLTLPDLNAGETYYFRVYGYGDAGRDGSFKLTASGITLPVQITSFKGERDGLRNVLSWTTYSEQNNKGFELQRSANGRDFSTLAFINSKAAGNSSAVQTYEFDDAKPFGGNSYYRLKQIDKDGRSKTTNIVLLKGLQANTFTLSNVYPNPAKSLVTINITAPAVNKINIIVTDLTGRLAMQQTAQITAGDNNLSLNVNKLSPGNYLIKAVCANGCETAVSRFVKQ